MVALDSSHVVAVLTGDLVNSTRMSVEGHDRVRTLLEKASAHAAGWIDGAGLQGPDFYRGDAWQLVLAEPRYFLRLAVFLQAYLAVHANGLETRIAIGLGTAEVIEPESVSRSIGDAFTLSGRALDDMGRRRGIALALPETAQHLSWMGAQVSACEFILSRWTRSQAEVALPLLEPTAPSQLEIAEAVKRPPQSVSRVFRDAGVYALLELLESVEAAPLGQLAVKVSLAGEFNA